MFGIQNIPPNYNYPQVLECSFIFFISVFSWELQDLPCSFFGAKNISMPIYNCCLKLPAFFWILDLIGSFIFLLIDKEMRSEVKFLCREHSETWFLVCVETPGPLSHDLGFWPQWHITNQDVSASDIIRNIWKNGIEVAFPYFLWRVVGEKRVELRES